MRYLLLRITALAFLIVTFSLPCRAAETGAQSLDSSWIKAMKANDLVGGACGNRGLQAMKHA
jgi:hypothetical protein